MYKGKKVSLVLPAYNEEDSIVSMVNNNSRIKIYDEIIVVDNNSKDRTYELASRTQRAKVVKENKQGYGFALRRGLAEAKGDVLVLCDCDNTYLPEDVKKMLVYSSKYDLVISTRTDKKYNLKGSNMFGLRRWANIFVGRAIQFLFNGPDMTDPGATFRIISRPAYEILKPQFKVGGVQFQPELTCLALLNGLRIKEVPVYYRARVGESKISGSFLGGFQTAKRMAKVIIYYWLVGWLEALLK